MTSTMMKDMIINEINLLPDEKLSEVYRFVHDFSLREEKNKAEENTDLLSFSGAWKDMDSKMFDDYLTDIRSRRNKAFSGRRSNAEISD